MASPPDVSGIIDNAAELDRLRKEQELVLAEIDKIHMKLEATPEVVEMPGDASLSRLKMLYTQAKDLSESEGSIATQLISQVDTLQSAGPPGQQQKRVEDNEQKGKSDISRVSPLMQNHLDTLASLKGEQVAARVRLEHADKDDWFVGKVIHFDRESREFEVLDEEPGDDEDSSAQRKYKLPLSHIIPFPKRQDPSSAQNFPVGTHVLAVYPGTTVLYRATVVLARQRRTDRYLLEFEDDEEEGSLPQRSVPFYKVVALPEGHGQ